MIKGTIVSIAAIIFAIAFIGCENPTDNNTATGNDKAILVVSFGTSYNDSRNVTIGGIESAISEHFPDYEVRRAFTAQIIIDILKDRDGIVVDSVKGALDKLVADGVKTLIVQPTHLMNGFEYDDLVAEVNAYKHKFESIAIGEPLLTSDGDVDSVIACITSRTASYVNDTTGIVFMGHGTHHVANAVYESMQQKLVAAGHSHYFVGTVEVTPDLDDVLTAVKAAGYKRVVLEPLMVVAGDHANNDMAGDEEGSWKLVFEAEGFEVQSILQGLGQFNEIQDIYVRHVEAAIERLK